MKNNYKKLILSMLIGTVVTGVYANNLTNTEKHISIDNKMFETTNVPKEIIDHCNAIVAPISFKNEDLKIKEAQKCVFSIDQQIKTEQINSELKLIEQKPEVIKSFSLKDVKTGNFLIKTTAGLRKAMLLPEGKTREFERIAVFYKDPNVDIKEKEKEANAYYKQFGENNYKVSKEVYEAFKELNSNLNNQKTTVLSVERALLDGVSESEVQKVVKKIEKDFSKEIEINNEILKNYDTYLMARKLDAKDALNKVVEGKKIKLSKAECKLLDKMYYRYEVTTFKNLSCK